MRINVPVNASVNGNWECDLLGHAWNVTKTVALWIASFAIIALFTTMGYCMSEFGSMAVLPWVLVLIIGGVVVGFGVGAIREQPTGMGKFGAVMLILLILSALVVGAVIFQKMMTTETPTAAVSTPTPIVSEVTTPQLQLAPPPVPSKAEHKAEERSGISSVRETAESPSVAQQVTPYEVPAPALVEDPCDPGGEKASAWGRRE